MTAALALCRFGRDAAALLLWGSCIYVAVLAPRPLRPRLSARYAHVHRAAAMTLCVAVLVALPVQAAALGEGWASAFDPALVGALLRGTTIGTAWLAQAGFAVVLLLVLPTPRRDAAAALVAAAILAATTISGHAAMDEGWLGGLHRANAALHLIAGGFWLGALVPLLGTLALLREPEHRQAATAALRRFSRVGHGAVALVIGSGILNTVLVLGRWPTDWRSPYQGLLAAKIAAVAAMTVLAILNRYRYVPRLRSDRAVAISRIRLFTLIEVGLGLLAVALVAWFGLLDPT